MGNIYIERGTESEREEHLKSSFTSLCLHVNNSSHCAPFSVSPKKACSTEPDNTEMDSDCHEELIGEIIEIM